MIGVTVTERKRRAGETIRKTHWVHPQLIVPKLLGSVCLFRNCQSTRTFSSLPRSVLPSQTHSLPHFPFLPAFLSYTSPSFLPHTVWTWADVNYPLLSLCLCPPASHESHRGQGPRGCQGLLMTPSLAITSGWQLYLHKTSRRCGEPVLAVTHSYINSAKGSNVIEWIWINAMLQINAGEAVSIGFLASGWRF